MADMYGCQDTGLKSHMVGGCPDTGKNDRAVGSGLRDAGVDRNGGNPQMGASARLGFRLIRWSGVPFRMNPHP
ncbi:MAG: hypothetical protein AMJ89_06000 [candidate division Zixibacteria bacterium SM23_73]|uniref:Uncharacterized protein n=1 Tax=candidate division WOR-1 bacterium DG_54_3 TaxID=1703775 RepID=A0A0S7XNA7_UNCSA|nr:MAG: hypothetical protein AMJ44_14370 [candidate division WOR-1 bacterium DG_54_3]KPK74544.1 MAG: hypothetical protein AMJ89_06000 [candidate division Zixibacteria bacterium SM23_73]